jgi:hypothetical protein
MEQKMAGKCEYFKSHQVNPYFVKASVLYIFVSQQASVRTPWMEATYSIYALGENGRKQWKASIWQGL